MHLKICPDLQKPVTVILQTFASELRQFATGLLFKGAKLPGILSIKAGALALVLSIELNLKGTVDIDTFTEFLATNMAYTEVDQIDWVLFPVELS